MAQYSYNQEGFRIVSESDRCPLWEKGSQPCRFGWAEDCFFCRFSNFRTPEYWERIDAETRTGKLHSLCRNEKNKRTENKL